jgi:hypothetical protein
MGAKTDLWKKINKCIVCGTKLEFVPSKQADALPQEGEKFCTQNHARFSVYGYYDAAGEWSTTFRLPVSDTKVKRGSSHRAISTSERRSAEVEQR